MKEYKNSFDTMAKIATGFTLIALSGMLFLCFYFQNISSLAFTLIFLGLALTIIIPALYFPRTYFLTEKELIVKRPAKDKLIPLNEIKSVERDLNGFTKRSIRLMGSGGFFGYFGLFRNSSLGRFNMYSTRLDHQVIIKTDKKTYVISPDEDEAFVAELESKIRP